MQFGILACTHRTLSNFISGYQKTKANDEILSDLKSLARQIHGHDDISAASELEGDILENLRTIESYIERLISLNTELVNKQAETEKTSRMREEAERLAARLAEERAEVARMEAEKKELMKKSESQNTQTDAEPPPRPPSPEPEPRPVAPVFVSGLTDTVITEGVSCRLSAQVSGVPVPRITWFKDGISVDQNTDYIATFQAGLCSLTIEETMKEDSANWSVRAANKAGYAESHAKLTVREVKPVVHEYPPLFVQPLVDCEAKEGEAVELSCKIDGKPFPSVSWFRNGVCVDKSRNYSIRGEEAECRLRIEKVYLEDCSTFTCRLENSHGAAVSGAKVRVQEVEPAVAPHLDLPLSNIVTGPGTEILLECSISGTPTPSLTWFKDNKAIKPSKDIEISYDGKTARLRVLEGCPSHAGHYVCKGHNTVGETTSTCTVYFKPTSPEHSEGESSQEGAKPAFYVPLANTEAREAGEVVLECVIVASPQAEVSWYHDNNLIRQAENIKMYSEEDRHRLVLKELEVGQAGKYKVVARNRLGESSSSCQLDVKHAKTSSSSQTQTLQTHHYTHTVTNKASEPKFVSPVQGKMVKAGESLVLEGTVSGSPQPRITWYRDNNQLTSGNNVKIEVLRNRTSLTITKVTSLWSVS